MFKNKLVKRFILFSLSIFLVLLGNLFPIFQAHAVPSSVYQTNTPTIFLSQKTLDIYVNDGGGDITTYPFVGPTQNRTYRVQPGRYRFVYDKLPFAEDKDGDGFCDLNSKGFCKIIKYSYLKGTNTKHAEQSRHLREWGNLSHRTWVMLPFVGENDNRPVKPGEFLNTFHSEVELCSRTKNDLYMQNNNPVNYFGDNPLAGISPGCPPPPTKIVKRYKSHGCIRLGRFDIWALYTFVIRNKDIGVDVPIVVLD